MTDWNKVESDVWNENEEPEVSGILIDVQDDVGPNHSKMYKLNRDGKAVSVWGSKVLDDLMLSVKVGQEIKIVFKGLVKPEKGNEYKSYELFSRPL